MLHDGSCHTQLEQAPAGRPIHAERIYQCSAYSSVAGRAVTFIVKWRSSRPAPALHMRLSNARTNYRQLPLFLVQGRTSTAGVRTDFTPDFALLLSAFWRCLALVLPTAIPQACTVVQLGPRTNWSAQSMPRRSVSVFAAAKRR